MTTIIWFRRDLRLEDNPAWAIATQRGDEVHPLFVVDPRLWDHVTNRRRSLMIDAMARVDASLAERGGRLRVEHGVPERVVPRLASQLGAGSVHVNREVTPFGARRDHDIAAQVTLVRHEGIYVHPPGSLRTSTGSPYRVFTPFYRKWSATPVEPSSAPGAAPISAIVGSGLPRSGSHRGSPHLLDPSDFLDNFLERVERYPERDLLDDEVTSRLSVALKYGTIGPRTVLEKTRSAPQCEGQAQFVRQLAWRDFFGHVMWARPDTVSAPMHNNLGEIRWLNDPSDIDAWKAGETGYPLVDAGMRQLHEDGWLNNRVRMVVASFLVKDLLVDWRIGERYMRRHLVDGDVAQNVGNWQWVAGTGADAAPFFRIMNPVAQSRRFDSDGLYIRRWLPELTGLDGSTIHAPWEVAEDDLARAGVVLDRDYPSPIIDHSMARARALEAFRRASS